MDTRHTYEAAVLAAISHHAAWVERLASNFRNHAERRADDLRRSLTSLQAKAQSIKDADDAEWEALLVEFERDRADLEVGMDEADRALAAADQALTAALARIDERARQREDVFLAQVDAQLDAWDATLDRLHQQAAATLDAGAQVQALRRTLAGARLRATALRSADAARRQALRVEVERAARELDAAITEVDRTLPSALA